MTLPTLVANIQRLRCAPIAADDLSAAPWRKHRRVDEVDAGVECGIDDSLRRCGVRSIAEHHRAEADDGHLDIALPESAIAHRHRVTVAAIAGRVQAVGAMVPLPTLLLASPLRAARPPCA
jgi:hypothetical protein